MKSIEIAETHITPKVILNSEENIFLIEGKSLPENPRLFYENILKWMDEYLTSPNEETIFCFKLEYFNTVSCKYLIILMNRLENLENVKIIWYSSAYDKLWGGEDDADEFAEIVKVPFEIRNY